MGFNTFHFLHLQNNSRIYGWTGKKRNQNIIKRANSTFYTQKNTEKVEGSNQMSERLVLRTLQILFLTCRGFQRRIMELAVYQRRGSAEGQRTEPRTALHLSPRNSHQIQYSTWSRPWLDTVGRGLLGWMENWPRPNQISDGLGMTESGRLWNGPWKRRKAVGKWIP